MSISDKSAIFQKLPSTDELLRRAEIQPLIEQEGQSAVAESIRAVLSSLRQEISAGSLAPTATTIS